MSVSLQLPILFDISAAGVVFGEDVSGVDIFDAHLKFTLDATAGGPASKIKEVFSDILYSDASENDVSGVLFYYNTQDAAPSAGDIAAVIQAAILNGKLKQAGGTVGTYGTAIGGGGTSQSAGTGTSDGTLGAGGNLTGDWAQRYQAPGIPLPMYSVTTKDSKAGPSTSPAQGYYQDALCDAGGTNFGRVLIRLMATSLMGHPFAQGFIKNESKIMEDISNCDISTQLGDNLFKGFYAGDDSVANYPKNRSISGVSQVLPAAKSSDPNCTSNKSVGIHNGILQQMYEQLLGSAPERFDISGSTSQFAGDDASGNDVDSGAVFPNRLPIRTNDTISFYFRPRVQISMDTDASSGVSTVTVDDTGTHDAGVQNEGDVASSYAASNTNLSSIFFQPRHRWISHSSNVDVGTDGKITVGNVTELHTNHKHCDSDGNLVMEGTNLIAADDTKLIFDGHVWRILCKIPAASS